MQNLEEKRLKSKTTLLCKSLLFFSFIRSRLYLQIVVFINILIVPLIFLIEFQCNTNMLDFKYICADFTKHLNWVFKYV